MISIKQHTNFSNWFQVYSFGKMVDEFISQAKAVDFAKKLAVKAKKSYVNVEGEAVEV
jgi:hypothetical protein